MGSKLDRYNWPPVCISWSRKKWASGWIFSTSLLFVFVETRGRWASVKAFTLSLLFSLWNGNNRNRVTSQGLGGPVPSPVHSQPPTCKPLSHRPQSSLPPPWGCKQHPRALSRTPVPPVTWQAWQARLGASLGLSSRRHPHPKRCPHTG